MPQISGATPQVYRLPDECVLSSCISPRGAFTALISALDPRHMNSNRSGATIDVESGSAARAMIYSLSILINGTGVILGPWRFCQTSGETPKSPSIFTMDLSQQLEYVEALNNDISILWDANSSGIFVCLSKSIFRVDFKWLHIVQNGLIVNIEDYLAISMLSTEPAVPALDFKTALPKGEGRNSNSKWQYYMALLPSGVNRFSASNASNGGETVKLLAQITSEVVQLQYRCRGQMIYIECEKSLVLCNYIHELLKVNWRPDGSAETTCIFSFESYKCPPRATSESIVNRDCCNQMNRLIKIFEIGNGVSMQGDSDSSSGISASADVPSSIADVRSYRICGYDDALKSLIIICNEGFLNIVSLQTNCNNKNEIADNSGSNISDNSNNSSNSSNSGNSSNSSSNSNSSITGRVLDFIVIDSKSIGLPNNRVNRISGNLGILALAVVESTCSTISTRPSLALGLYNMYSKQGDNQTSDPTSIGGFTFEFALLSSVDVSNYYDKRFSRLIYSSLQTSYCSIFNSSSLQLSIHPIFQLSQVVFQSCFASSNIPDQSGALSASFNNSRILFNMSFNYDKLIFIVSRVGFTGSSSKDINNNDKQIDDTSSLETRLFDINLKQYFEGSQSNNIAIERNIDSSLISIFESIVSDAPISDSMSNSVSAGYIYDDSNKDIEFANAADCSSNSSISAHPLSDNASLITQNYNYRYLQMRSSVSFQHAFNIPLTISDSVSRYNHLNHMNSELHYQSGGLIAAHSGKCQIVTIRNVKHMFSSNNIAIITKVANERSVDDNLIYMAIYNKLSRRTRTISLSSSSTSDDYTSHKSTSNVFKSTGRIAEPIELAGFDPRDSLAKTRNDYFNNKARKQESAETISLNAHNYLLKLGFYNNADRNIGAIQSTNDVLFCSDNILVVLSHRSSRKCLEILSRSQNSSNIHVHRTILLPQAHLNSASSSIHCMAVDKEMISLLFKDKNRSADSYLSLTSMDLCIHDIVYIISVNDGKHSSSYIIAPIISRNCSRNMTGIGGLVDFDFITLWNASFESFNNVRQCDSIGRLGDQTVISGRTIICSKASNPFYRSQIACESSCGSENYRDEDLFNDEDGVSALFATLNLFGEVWLFDPFLLRKIKLSHNIVSLDSDILFPYSIHDETINDIKSSITGKIKSMFLIMLSRDHALATFPTEATMASNQCDSLNINGLSNKIRASEVNVAGENKVNRDINNNFRSFIWLPFLVSFDGSTEALESDSLNQLLSRSLIPLSNLGTYQSFVSSTNGKMSLLEYIPLVVSSCSGFNMANSFKMCEVSLHFIVFMFVVSEICRCQKKLASIRRIDSFTTSSDRINCLLGDYCEKRIAKLAFLIVEMFDSMKECQQNNYSLHLMKPLLIPLVENIEYRIRDIAEAFDSSLGDTLCNSSPEYRVILSLLYNLDSIYESRRESINKSSNNDSSALPGVLMEVMSLLLRKLEPSVSKHLFPIPTDISYLSESLSNQIAAQSAADIHANPISPTSLSIFESSLYQADLNRSIRLLTPACDFLGGCTEIGGSSSGEIESSTSFTHENSSKMDNISSYSKGGLLLSLKLSFEVLHNCFNCASLRNFVDCFNFIYRMENILKCLSDELNLSSIERNLITTEFDSTDVSSTVYDKSLALVIKHVFDHSKLNITSTYSKEIIESLTDIGSDLLISSNNDKTNSKNISNIDSNGNINGNIGGSLILDIAYSLVSYITYPFYSTYEALLVDPIAPAAKSNDHSDHRSAHSSEVISASNIEGDKHRLPITNNNSSKSISNSRSELISTVSHSYKYTIYDRCVSKASFSSKPSATSSDLLPHCNDKAKLDHLFKLIPHQIPELGEIPKSMLYILLQAQFLFQRKSYFGVALLFLSMQRSSNFKFLVKSLVRENLKSGYMQDIDLVDLNYNNDVTNYCEKYVTKYVLGIDQNTSKRSIIISSDNSFVDSCSAQNYFVFNSFLDILYSLVEAGLSDDLSKPRTAKLNGYFELYQNDLSKKAEGCNKALVFEKSLGDLSFDFTKCNFTFNRSLDMAFNHNKGADVSGSPFDSLECPTSIASKSSSSRRRIIHFDLPESLNEGSDKVSIDSLLKNIALYCLITKKYSLFSVIYFQYFMSKPKATCNKCYFSAKHLESQSKESSSAIICEEDISEIIGFLIEA